MLQKATVRIQGNPSIPQSLRFTELRRTPPQSAHPRQQFFHGEGLYQVIVRPRVQPLHPVADIGQGRDHQHRGGDAPLPQTAEELDAVYSRQHPVQQDQLVLSL